MKKISVSIVIPNWNGKELLSLHLPSVIRASDGREIIVSDDASTDGSVEFISQTYPDITIVRNTTHKGFASTVNTGVSRATGRIVLLLNTDVEPEEGCIDFLIPHFADKNVFAVGCLEKSHEDNSIVLRGNGEAWWEKGFFLHKKGDEKNTYTSWVSGGSGAFRKSMWEGLGGMDTLFDPFYWEDIDISYRALKSGYELKFEPKSIVHHYHSKGKILTGFSKSHIRRIALRNQFFFIWKNMTDSNIIRSHLLYLPVRIMQAILRFDFAFISGFLSAICMISAILHKRGEVQTYTKLHDRDILEIK